MNQQILFMRYALYKKSPIPPFAYEKLSIPPCVDTEGSSLTTCGLSLRSPCSKARRFTHCFCLCVNPSVTCSCRISFVGFYCLSLTFVLICRLTEDVRSGQFVCRGLCVLFCAVVVGRCSAVWRLQVFRCVRCPCYPIAEVKRAIFTSVTV